MNKWQLQQRFLNTGSHLAKRPRKMWDKYVAPATDYWGRSTTPVGVVERCFGDYCNSTGCISPYGKWHGRISKNSDINGNLAGEQYRWYMGHPIFASLFSQCRVCLEVCTSSIQRLRHQKEQGCCALLAMALKRIKTYGLCAVCNAETTTEKWGLPLCSNFCEHLWKFDVCQPLALRQELLLLTLAKKRAERAVSK